jgi:hypothetical protein
MGTTLREVFVVEFPCGAFRMARTRKGAQQVGDQVAADRTCCAKGHDSWEVRRVPAVRHRATRSERWSFDRQKTRAVVRALARECARIRRRRWLPTVA